MSPIDQQVKEKKAQLCGLRNDLRTFQAELLRLRDSRPDTLDHLRSMQQNIESAEDDLIDLEEEKRRVLVPLPTK